MNMRFPLFALAIVALTGCKPDAPASNTPTTPSGTQAASGGSSSEKIKISFIPKNTGNPYFDGIAQGLNDACKELGCEVNVTGPAVAEPTSQISFIKDEVQRGAKVIVLAANSPDALNATLDEAKAKGVHIITVDSDLTGNESHREVGVFATDFSKMGEFLLDLIGGHIGYEGKFAILSATTDAPNQTAWIKSINEIVKQPKYAKMQLVDTVFGDDKDQKSVTEAEGLLTKYPDLKGILAPTTVGVAAAAKVVESRKVFDRVKVTGLGTPNQMRRFVNDGVVPNFALWSPPDMGVVCAHVGVALVKGDLKPQKGAKVTCGKLGEKEITDKNMLIIGPPTVFDKANIEQFKF
jgi:rhamnose transport system substrate-binding protein